jgi:hypothetical protein
MRGAGATFERAKTEFEKNLALEKNNLTETNEKDYLERLVADYGAFVRLSGPAAGATGASQYFAQVAPTSARIRTSIDDIFDVNLQASLRKNQLAKESAKTISHYMIAIGVIFTILALAYFWYFPFYVSYSLAYVAGKMKQLLHEAGLESRSKSDDEMVIITHSIDLLRARSTPTDGQS